MLAARLLCLVMVLHCSFAPPVTPEKKEHEKDSEIKDDLEEYMEYHRYLKEVVQALESDPDFRERLEKANDDDVRSGKIAEQLDFVNHNVRSKLDEIKRRELDRLRHLATKQYELSNDIDTKMSKVTNEHLDHENPHTFEIEDLKKLIKKTTSDLEEADKQRKQDFKEYEMQKEFEKHQKLEALDEEQKKEFQKKIEEEEKAKKHHQPASLNPSPTSEGQNPAMKLHHPGSKQQLEEVWEKQDHMDQNFDPKAFFMMHDVDGNGVWDADEVKALFVKELDKLYGPGGPNKDKHERAEEMERMREHVFQEADKNRDGLIDFKEFMTETQKADFNQDQGWQSLDENQIYTQSEYQEFERRRLEELQFLQQRGLVDAHGRPLPGAEHQIHEAFKQRQAHLQQQAYQQHQYQQGAPPQGYQGQAPGQGYQQPGQFQQPPQPLYQQQQAYQQPQAQVAGQQQVYQGQVPPQQVYQQAPGQPHQAYQQAPGQPQQAYQQAPGQPQQVYQQAPGQPQQAYQQPPPQQNPPPGQNQAYQPPPNQPPHPAQVAQQAQAPQAQAPQAQAQQPPVAAPQSNASQGQAPPPNLAPNVAANQAQPASSS